MAKLSLALLATLSSAAAFAPSKVATPTTSLNAITGFEETGGEPWDPLSLYTLEDSADTFPNMFPKSQFIDEAEIKHGRMAMLAWTGVWATHVVSNKPANYSNYLQSILFYVIITKFRFLFTFSFSPHRED